MEVYFAVVGVWGDGGLVGGGGGHCWCEGEDGGFKVGGFGRVRIDWCKV